MASSADHDESWYGIRQVYPSSSQPLPKGKQLLLDVVCVHGLNGHAHRSFTHRGTKVFWPRDLLPADVPTARVLTFGYDASSERAGLGQSIFDIALQLTNNLKDVRREESERNRDILFVCHSLGGIIVKKAILLHHTNEKVKAVQSSIVGIFFLGTPHCGSDVAHVGAVVALIASTFVSAPRHLVKMLKKSSTVLYEISREFAVEAANLDLHLTTFYELNPLPMPILGLSRIIVEKRSAILGLPGEDIIAVHGHHGELAKFASAADPKYRPIWIRIEDLSRKAEEKFAGDRESKDGMAAFETVVAKNSEPQETNMELLLANITLPEPANMNQHFRLPFQPSASFTGRESALQRIQNHFSESVYCMQHRFVIYGLGGSGKTQLALTYAYKNRHTYTGVWFIDADTESSLQEDIEKIHDDLKLNLPTDKPAAVWRHFDSDKSTTWLLIYDNADNPHAYDLSHYFPYCENVHILITSRDHTLSELATESVLLEMLDPEESQSLLIARAGLVNPTEKTLHDIRVVAEQLFHLPLAIDQAGSYMRTRQCSPAAYLRRFETERERVLKFSPKLSPYKKSVITAWEVSFMRLETDLPLAAKLLLLFSYLDSRRISEALLIQIAEPVTKMDADGNPHSVPAEEGGIDIELIELMRDPDAYDDAVQKLLSFSLIRLHTETVGAEDHRVFSLHPLVAYYTQSRTIQAIKRQFAEQAICVLNHAFPEWSINFDVIEFGRLTRSHLIRCLTYIDQPEIFGSNLEEHAKKLLLIVWSVRTVQLFNMKPNKTESEQKMLSTAYALAEKYGDAYIATAAASVHYRHLDSKELSEKMCSEFLQKNNLQKGRNPDNPEHGGRFNAALGDLVIFRACLRRDLRRGDDPSILLQAWRPINPENPSTLERNAKWWRDRTVGSQYTAIGKYKEAEKLLLDHVAEFTKINFTGTDEHLMGACYLAQLYYVLKDWKKAEDALRGPMDTAERRSRDRMAWHVMYAEIRFLEILVCGRKFMEAKPRVLQANRQLQEKALPDFTMGQIFSTWCLLAQIAHEQQLWAEAKEYWAKALELGESVDWPVGPEMNLARCSLEAIGYETQSQLLDKKTFQTWREAIHVSPTNAEGGHGNQFNYGFGDEWRERVTVRLQKCIVD